MEQKIKKKPHLTIGMMMIGTLVGILTSVSISIALPEIMRDLQIESYSTVQWLTTVNMLVAGVVIPTSAFFMTRFKSHHIFITAMSAFIIGAVFAIFVPNFPLLLVARIIQAMGVSILMPLLMNVLLASFSREQRGKAMGLYGLIFMLAPVMGPIISGILVDNFGWRMIFITVAFLAIVILALSLWKLENVLEQRKTSIDVLSVILSSISFSSILLGFNNASSNGWTDISVYGVILIGFVALALFVIRQFKIKTPLLDLKVYTYPMFALSSFISMILAMVLFAPMVLLPYYFQNIQGYSILKSGLIVIPGSLLMACCMPLAGKLYDRFSALSLAMIGFPLIGISSYFMSMLHGDTSAIYVGIWFAIRSIGIALIMMPVQTNGLNQLPAHLSSSGVAINNTVQQVSGAIGTAIFVTLKTNYSTVSEMNLLNEAKAQMEYPLLVTVQEEISKLAGLGAINHTSLVTIGFVLVAFFFSLFIRKRIYHEDNMAQLNKTA